METGKGERESERKGERNASQRLKAEAGKGGRRPETGRKKARREREEEREIKGEGDRENAMPSFGGRDGRRRPEAGVGEEDGQLRAMDSRSKCYHHKSYNENTSGA